MRRGRWSRNVAPPLRALPGDSAHTLKHAAVAITLVEAADGSGEAALILTGRAAGLRSHGGQWALPGGRCDAGETPARRRCASSPRRSGSSWPSDILGTLDDYPTRSGYLITPVVVWGGDHPPLRLNADEVAAVGRIRARRYRARRCGRVRLPFRRAAAGGAHASRRPRHPCPDRGVDLPVREILGGRADPRRRARSAGIRLAISER